MIHTLFPTEVYYGAIGAKRATVTKLNRQLLLEAEDIAELDTAGQKWSKKNYCNGFTSYASTNDLHRRSSTFARLESLLQKHVARYVRKLNWDLGNGTLKMSSCWINIMPENTYHSLHLHPLSLISGTYYVSTPAGVSGIKFEDPRLDKMMAAPPARQSAAQKNQRFVSLPAMAGNLLLFESWLRHEVPMNTTARPRVSISFNYGWA